MEMISIGCKLPHGLIIELGYTVDKTSGSVLRNDDYQRIRLNGAHEASGAAAIARAGLMAPPPNPLNFAAGITSVPKAFWDSWKSKHQSMFAKLSKSGVLFEAKNDNDAKAKAIDVLKEPTRFEPLNPKKLPVAGVAKADFLE